MRRKWTEEETEFLRKNYKKIGPSECAAILERTVESIWVKARRMNLNSGRYFTDKQRRYIENNIGKIPLSVIAKRTGHSYDAVRVYISRNGLSHVSSTNNRMTVKEFSRLMHIDDGTIRHTYAKYGLSITKAGRFCTVDIDEAMEWLRTHPERWDATRCEKWFFQRYAWFEEKRKVDFDRMIERRWGA